MIWRRVESVVFDDRGDPANGSIGVGCVIDVLGQTEFRPGLFGIARIGLVASDFAEVLQAPVDIWCAASSVACSQ